jgi:aminomethyltransferase
VAYGLFLTPNGGVLDDVMGYRLGAARWLIVSNASRAAEDESNLQREIAIGNWDVTCSNRYADQAMLAIQGPQAALILKELCDIDVTAMLWRDVLDVELAGAKGLLARGGYTGSDGFEFLFGATEAPAVWNELMQAGALPCGLGARDVLRLEAGLPLYGHELREEWTPVESGVAFAFKPEKGPFVGRDAALRAPVRSIVALHMEGRGIPRDGYDVAREGETVGWVTSGTMSPTLNAGIALASVARDAEVQVGDALDVLIRGTAHPARVVKRPFVPHAR